MNTLLRPLEGTLLGPSGTVLGPLTTLHSTKASIRVQISVITISVCNDQDLSGVGNCTQISESLEKVFTAQNLALFLVSAA